MGTNGGTDDNLAAGRDALARCDWAAAAELLGSASVTDPAESAARLDLLGEAYWWLGDVEACIGAREQAYAAFDELALGPQAGQVAIWLYEHHQFLGHPAIGSAWLGRARRQLAGHTDCTAWGNLLLREAEAAHGHGELAAALDAGHAALALGRRLRSSDLEAESLQTLGRVTIDDGRPRDGMELLDEAMLLAVEGKLGPYATGKVYCSLVGACEDLGDLRRAAEWTEATVRWSEGHPFAVFPGLCRVKRAAVLQWRGDWDAAEIEARRACEELATIKVGTAAAAWAEVGEIRRRIGDLAGAEESFARAQELCYTPFAGLALLRLAQGRADAAVAIIDGGLADTTWSPTARARLLPAKVQVAIAVGDLDSAERSADELDGIARTFATPATEAAALTARGRLLLTTGDHATAAATLRRAVELWRGLEVPYEAATAEVLLGRACREIGDADGEAAAFASAAQAFERLGARYDARQLAALNQPHGLPCGLSGREVEVLRLVSSGRTNKEVAASLGLSQKTVARHVENIFAKIGVETRSGATAFAFRSGLIAPNP